MDEGWSPSEIYLSSVMTCFASGKIRLPLPRVYSESKFKTKIDRMATHHQFPPSYSLAPTAESKLELWILE